MQVKQIDFPNVRMCTQDTQLLSWTPWQTLSTEGGNSPHANSVDTRFFNTPRTAHKLPNLGIDSMRRQMRDQTCEGFAHAVRDIGMESAHVGDSQAVGGHMKGQPDRGIR
jgi:hypothetical protein